MKRELSPRISFSQKKEKKILPRFIRFTHTHTNANQKRSYIEEEEEEDKEEESSECFDLEEEETQEETTELRLCSKRNTEPTRSRSSTARSWTKGTKSSYHRARWTDCRNSETWILPMLFNVENVKEKTKRTAGF